MNRDYSGTHSVRGIPEPRSVRLWFHFPLPVRVSVWLWVRIWFWGSGSVMSIPEPIRPLPSSVDEFGQESQKSGVGSSRVVDQPRIRADDPPLCDGIPQSGGGASKEDEEHKIRPVDDSKKDKKPKTPANDSEKDEKPEKPKTPANDSEENEKPKTPARDDSNGDPPLRQAELPLNELLVLLAVYAVLLALLPVDTLKSQPGTKATTVTVLYAFAFSVVIWLKLQQPRITKGYTLISICQFLIRLVFTGGFVCIACIVSVFIPDGLGWIVIYVSVNGTVSCILVAWDIASMFRAAVSAETHNA